MGSKKIFVTWILLLLVGCQGSSGTSTGNPLVALSFGAYDSNALMKLGMFSVNSLKMCFKRLRFKTSGEPTAGDPSLDSDNIDFYLGEVTISPLGTNLGAVNVPTGTYARIEFDLDDSCPSKNSIELQNSNGTFVTNDRITIKFEGAFTLSSNRDLELVVQNLITALNSVAADSEIKTQAESVSGSF